MENSKHRILRLSPEVVGHIAAGEVVERPAAAIKELVENSMDAGATAITVDIREGGLHSIRVVDNGSGIDESELRMAFERHATSKLRTQEDLQRIGTLGFRGEALSSIAAVSKVRLISRPRGQESGMEIRNEGGQIVDIKPAAAAEGTSVSVQELFYNAPVRRRFMKKPAQEAQLIADLMQRLILSHPEISFRFMVDGKPVYFSPGDGRQDTAMMSILGINTLRQLHQVEGQEGGVLLSGYVGVGEASRGNRSQQLFFINGRAMRSQLLSQALEEACRQRVMVGRFPMCALWLTMPYEAVDVNVHPNKWELRFVDERAVSQALTNLVQDALKVGAAAHTPPPLFVPPPAAPGVPPQVERTEPDAGPAQTGRPFASSMSLRAPGWESGPAGERKPGGAPAEPEQMHAGEHLPELKLAPLRLLGAAFSTYIIYETQDSICICDQHAMHERIMFDRLMQAYRTGAIAQTLMIPQAVELSYREYGTFQEHQALLAEAGFDAEDFGEQTVKLHSLPMSLGQPQAQACFIEALEDLGSGGQISGQKRVERIIQAACKHAVKGGERLPEDAMMSLLRDVLEGNVTPTCPHGRPLMLQLSRTELEKRFQRIPG